MSVLKFFLFILAVSGMMFACRHRTSKPASSKTEQAAVVRLPEKKLQIIDHGTVEFGKSYSFLQDPYISDREKDKKSLIEETRNPYLQHTVTNLSPAVQSLILKLQTAGIVKGEDFLEKRFKGSTDTIVNLIDSQQRKPELVFESYLPPGTNRFRNWRLILGKDNADTLNVDVDIIPHYILKDIIPGGNKELVLLNEYYMMNHFFYYLTVYEIKTR